LSITPELYDFIVKVVEDKVKEVKVSREEYDRLVRAVRELAAAQRATERRLEALAEAQRRTEERLELLAVAQSRTEERLKALAEAQKLTEQRLEKLAERLGELAAAQSRTERRLEQLAEAQRRTEERLERLAKVVEGLVAAVDELRRSVGALAETVGYGLEDVARVVVPGWLHRHLGVEVESLRREFVEVDGEEVELDLFGEGTMRGERVLVLGEVKSRIYEDDVNRFYNRKFARVSRLFPKYRKVGVLFGYLVHPRASRRARELGLYVIASYER